MRLADYLAKRKKSKSINCDICDAEYAKLEDMELHRRDLHPDASPRIADA